MKYTGSCHCGQVKYEVELELESAAAASCNCSICSRKGYVLTFVPPEQFTLLQGADSLKDYQFNKKHIHHYFCANCGVTSFMKGINPGGIESYAINLNCLEDADLSQLKIHQYNGKDL